jgi:hypothetical protein
MASTWCKYIHFEHAGYMGSNRFFPYTIDSQLREFSSDALPQLLCIFHLIGICLPEIYVDVKTSSVPICNGTSKCLVCVTPLCRRRIDIGLPIICFVSFCHLSTKKSCNGGAMRTLAEEVNSPILLMESRKCMHWD